jgi:hypothetical protein
MARGDADSAPVDLLAGPIEPGVTPLDAARRALGEVPPLAVLAALAALVHLVVQKLLLPLMAVHKITLPTLLVLVAPFSLNLSVLAALVALGSGMVELVRAPLTYLSRRLLVAGLSSILVSMLALCAFAPEGTFIVGHILLATGALHTLVVQVAMITLRSQESLAGRTTVSLIASASLFPLAALMIRHADAGFLSFLAHAEGTVPALYGLGELGYLLMPIAAAFVVVPWESTSAGRFARRAGAFGVGITGLLFAAGATLPRELYGHVLYATLRLEWSLQKASLGYAVPVSLAAGAATAAIVSADPRKRQGGAGLLLWLAGGFNPLSPARLALSGLGAVLVCRAVLTLWEGRPKVSAT